MPLVGCGIHRATSCNTHRLIGIKYVRVQIGRGPCFDFGPPAVTQSTIQERTLMTKVWYLSIFDYSQNALNNNRYCKKKLYFR